MAELQLQLQHHDPHMNTGDTIQIEAPDFDPVDQESNNPVTQGLATPTPKFAEKVIEHITPAPSHQDTDIQEVDWPDAIPVEIPSQSNQQNNHSVTTQLT